MKESSRIRPDPRYRGLLVIARTLAILVAVSSASTKAAIGQEIPFLTISASKTTLVVGESIQLTVTGHYLDGEIVDVTSAAAGTEYVVDLTDVAAITSDGLLTAGRRGVAVVTASNYGPDEGLTGTIRLRVVSPGDQDDDQLPDAYEVANGLDPQNALDSFLDPDRDGVDNLHEFLIDTSPHNPDSDGDGTEDGVEIEIGTDPLVVDGRLGPDCTVSLMNRTVPVARDGSYLLSNVPVGSVLLRITASCMRNGISLEGVSSFFLPVANQSLDPGAIMLVRSLPLPVSLHLASSSNTITDPDDRVQLMVSATLSDGGTLDVTSIETGTLFSSSNTDIGRLVFEPLANVRGLRSGQAIVTAVSSGVLAAQSISVQLSADVDGDQLPDDYEQARGCLALAIPDGNNDPDADGVTNFLEFTRGTEPCQPDTDGDGLGDGLEFVSSPVLPDTDLDGVLDGAEPAGNNDGDALPNILDPDSDNDGLRDGIEVRICGTIFCANPFADADGDQITNLDEVLIFTDPLDADTDDDGLTDGFEVLAHTDPLVPDRLTPTVTLTDPAQGTQVVRGGATTLRATATDDGRVTRVEFFVGGVQVGTDFTSPYTANFNVPDSSQSLSIEVRATDTNNNTGSTGVLIVGVRPDPLTTVTGLVLDNAGVAASGAAVRVRIPEVIVETGTTTIDGTSMTVAPGTQLGTSTLAGTMSFVAGDKGLLDTVVDLRPAGTFDVTGTLGLDFTGNNPSSPTPRSGTLSLNVSRLSGTSFSAQGPITGVLPVSGQTPIEIDLPVTSFNAGGLQTALALQGRDVRVRLQGFLAIQADGSSSISDLSITGNPELIVTIDPHGATGSDGRFSVAGVPTIYGDVIVDATFQPAAGAHLQGASTPAAPVRGGTTDVGAIHLAAAPAVSVFPYPAMKVGRDPGGVAAGDFNGDGNDDLAVTSGSEHLVFIMLGNGSGTFGPDGINFTVGGRVSAGSRPVWVITLDLNNDGRLDLVTANIDSDNVQSLLGNGSGGFTSAGNFAAGTRPETLSAGDFNRDGRPDLVVAQRASSDLSILIGNGDGTFRPQVRIPIAGGPRAAAVADLTGDGILDIATANVNSDTVTILAGNGDGTFTVGATLAAGDGTHSIVIGDFNGDGKKDIAAANYLSDDVSVLLGNGNGTFAAQVRYQVGDAGESILAMDVNGGGTIDLVVLDGISGELSILLGNGDGSFRPRRDYAFGIFPHGLTVGDFNRDGAKDFASANSNQTAVVMFGQGDGTFRAKKRVAISAAFTINARSIATGDFNADGKADVVTALGDLNAVAVFAGNGDATFGPQANYGMGTFPLSVKVADVNADGKQDLVAANTNSNDVSVRLGNGDGTFGAQLRFTAGVSPRDVAVGDFNGDGKKDLAVACFGAPPLFILLGNGDGTFGAAQSFASGTDLFSSVAVSDFNADGKQDLAIVKFFSNEVGIMLGNGDGTFPFPTFYSAGNFSIFVDVGDFNSDGKADVAVANLVSDDVSVLFGNGNGTFAPRNNYQAGDNPEHVLVADFNGDGRPDIVVSNPEPEGGNVNDIVLLLNKGDGTFPARGLRLSVGGNPFAAAAADFNGDGRLDIVSVDTDSKTFTILLNRGP